MMTFAEHIAGIPYAATQQNATGLLAPIMRAVGHILFAATATADTGYTITVEEALVELAHAEAHLNTTASTTERAPLSDNAKSRILNFVNAVTEAISEWAEWSDEDRVTNLKILAHRAAAIGAFLDGELAGITDSDPGLSV